MLFAAHLVLLHLYSNNIYSNNVFRYAFKLTYDEAVLGPVDDHDELLETLKDYEENWCIGIENKPGWNEAILQEKANLFTIGYDADKVSEYRLSNIFSSSPSVDTLE